MNDMPMTTSTRETRGLFSFTDSRMKLRPPTLRHSGNSPSEWLTSQSPCKGWLNADEIDNFEAMNSRKKRLAHCFFQMVFNLGNASSPCSSFNEECTTNTWHIYNLEWTENLLTWYVGGRTFHSKKGFYIHNGKELDIQQGFLSFS